MKRLFSAAIVLTSLASVSLPAIASAASPVSIGGQAVETGKSILDNAAALKDLSIFSSVVKTSGMMNALSGIGPLTIFVPNNGAFASLPQGALADLVKPENKVQLASIVNCHVVAGDYSGAKLHSLVKKGGGKATLKSITGCTLTITSNGASNLVIKDEKGGMADIAVYDAPAANGVIHVIDKVLMPGS